MARIPERKFDPARPVYARKYFIAAGRKFAPGDLFDWRAAMVTPRRALQLFDAGKLTHNGVTVDDKIEAVTPPVEQEITVEDNLDAIEDMKELRRIADEIGAPYKVSKADQRQAIRDHRKETD